jgi:single-stranded DNA-binding protein
LPLVAIGERYAAQNANNLVYFTLLNLGILHMLVTVSGNTGRTAEIKFIPRKDGNGKVVIGETSLAVKVTTEDTDWYKLKFVGDSLAKAAEYITKGAGICVVGEFTFENWQNEHGEPCARPVINVSEIQLPPKPKTV